MEEQEFQQTAIKSEPEFLYHYTTEKGLDGILEKESIWATHYRFLNDLSECLEAPELFEAIIRQLSSTKLPQSDLAKDGREKFWGRIGDRLRAQIESSDAYFVSFTDESTSQMPGDRLTLWRGYAGRSQGFSLGFCQNKLQQRVQSFGQQLHNKPIPLMKCLYGETEESRYEVKAIIGTLASYICIEGNQVLEKVLEWSAKFKNKAF
jgi:hypothetical protein